MLNKAISFFDMLSTLIITEEQITYYQLLNCLLMVLKVVFFLINKSRSSYENTCKGIIKTAQ